MQDNTREVAKKMCQALIESEGYPYAAGYFESFLVSVIEKYVTNPDDRAMLKMEMLNIGINQFLDKKAKQNVST